jgi:hypothetical protein
MKVKKRTQKLSEELNNTPSHTSLVACSVNPALNRDESLSEQSTVLTDNNLEVNLRQHTGGLKGKTYVLSISGKPLMPCSNTKARKLLAAKRAVIVTKYPFTIKLTFECENKVQDVTLGIDTGYEYIGFSAVTDKAELISGEMKLDGSMCSRLTEKAMYRKGRRNKLWYREPRWSNRKNMVGKCPPSVFVNYCP